LIGGGVGSTEIGDMDRDEALKLLKGGPEGVAEWNRLLEAKESIPELDGADLRGASLNEVDLCAVHSQIVRRF